MVLTGTYSLTNWMNSRPFTGRSVSIKRNVRAHPTVITAIASSADGSFSDDSGDSDAGSVENTSSSWRGRFSSWSFPAPSWPLVLRTVAFHATHITARLISQPFQPAWERIQQRAASSAAVQSACAAFQVDDLASLHDVANALVLAECVYKVVGRPEQEAVRIMSCLKSNFPPGIVTISSVQFARSHVKHRFAISQSDDAMYVAFMGTKLPRDFIANAAAWQEEVQLDADTFVKSNDAEKMTTGEHSSHSSTSPTSQQAPAAHRGFLDRARGIPIDALFSEAQKRGKRLVLCGHSLGGAVATLTAISLLQRLPPEQHNAVSVVGFATPALGNTALANMVEERKWHDRIINYLVPEDPIPRLLSINNNNGGTSTNNNNGTSGSAKISGEDNKLKLESGSGAGHIDDAVNESQPQSSQFDVVGNIAAVPARILSLSRGSFATKQEQEKEVALADAADIKFSTEIQIEDQSNVNTSTLPAQSTPGFRSSISQGTLKMVNIATAPLRRPNYQPIGRQLFICEEAVKTERPVGSSSNSRSNPSSSSPVLPTLQRSSSGSTIKKSSSTGSSEQLSTATGWWPKLPFSSSLLFLPHVEGEGDDDNVDIAAATAAAGGIVPDRLPKRTLFPMHRMLTYRTRLLSICLDALSGHRWPVSLLPASSTLATLPHVPNFPHPDDIVLSELLAPGMFPLKAEAAVPMKIVQRKQQHALSTSTTTTAVINPRVPLMMAAGQKLAWPLRVLLRRPRKDITDTVPVDVVVRVEGRGLCNVTSAWVSGGQIDVHSGKSTPIEAEILSIPRAPVPSQVVQSSTTSGQKSSGGTRKKMSSVSLVEPVSALASWVALAVGWVSLLEKLQRPAESDYLLARVKLPASTVRAAHRSRLDPFLVAVGEGPRLMMHLESDFAVHSLPLTVQVVDNDDANGGGGSGRGGKNKSSSNKENTYKDANQFLRNAKSGLPHLYR